MSDYIIDTEFKDRDFLILPLQKGDYENCKFNNCTFNKVDLSQFSFCECTFFNCHFNACNIYKTSWREVTFIECKLTGLHFEDCNNPMVDITFSNTTLELCSLADMKWLRLQILNSKLKECDFSNAHVEAAKFLLCNFENSKFENTYLVKANFKNSYNYLIDPEQNSITKAVFSIQAIEGLLYKYNIVLES